MVSYKVVLYCPDQHIESNLATLDHKGVGGGITARIRIAHALAKNGHQVSLYINCPRSQKVQGVQYQPFSQIGKVTADIFIASTSNSELNLGMLNPSSVNARMKIMMLMGVDFPKQNAINPDFVYIPSNFIRSIACNDWTNNPASTFVSNYGVQANFVSSGKKSNDLNKLVYLSHPSKGLNAAISVFRILRQENKHLTLHVFGGNKLWGENEGAFIDEAGIIYHGLVGQKKLAAVLQNMGFSLNLQTREEPFGMVVTESMAAGCIVLASPVGAFTEIIRNGFNGFLVEGNSTEELTILTAAGLISRLQKNPNYVDYVRRNAINTPFSWNTIARAWEGHWNWYFKKQELESSAEDLMKGCYNCGGRMLMLADGFHCVECGFYQHSLS